MKREWFNFQASADDASVVDIHIIDVIGGWDSDWIARNWGYDMGVTARAFVDELAKISADVRTIRVHINSPGGDVFAGVNIANALRDQRVSKGRSVVTYVDGVAASIASVIAMAGEKVVIGDNALMMIHNPYSWVVGNAAAMRKAADDLDVIRTSIVASYKWHTTKTDEEIVALLDAETWLDADQAVAMGFATEKVEGLKAAASINRRAVDSLNVPEQFRARVTAFLKPEQTPDPKPEPMAALEVVRACKAAGCADLSEELIAAGATTDTVTARLTEAKATREKAAARATTITSLCDASKRPDLAASLIRSAMSLEDVRAHLGIVRAAIDEARGHLDTGIDPDLGQPANIRASWKAAAKRAGVGVKAS
jgi:ATP-dependent protease ClpP protease subunit